MNKNMKRTCSLVALVLGAAALILYLTTGVIPGFTDALSTSLIVLAAAGVAANLLFTFVRFNTLELFPFVAYIVSIFLFLQVNANYMVAVVRAIDITSVSATFVLNIVLFLAAAVVYLVSFKEQKK